MRHLRIFLVETSLSINTLKIGCNRAARKNGLSTQTRRKAMEDYITACVYGMIGVSIVSDAMTG
jgi:hypothetical protein